MQEQMQIEKTNGKKVKAVVFDLDGMIVVGEIFTKRLEKEYGIPSSKSVEFFNKEFKDCRLGLKDLKAEIAPYAVKWGWKGTVNELLDFWFDGNPVDERFFPIIQKLRKKGVKCFLTTNQAKTRAEYYKKKLEGWFDFEFHSCYLGALKPSKEFFDFVFSKLKLKPEEVMAWDDKLEFVEGERKLGMKAELYTSFEEFKKKVENI